jgi:hypothetical protein
MHGSERAIIPASDNHTVPGLDPSAVLDTLVSNPSLRGFVRDGTICAIPVRQSKRRMLLDVVAQVFEPGIRYPERDVDAVLRKLHYDHAALRRYLVDEELLDRANGMYWRIGGTVS